MKAFKYIFLLFILSTFNANSYTIFSSFGSCKTWNSYMEKDKNDSFQWKFALSGWLAGFSSGLNVATGEENFPNIDLETMQDYVIGYCKKKPDGDAYDGVLEIREKLKKR